MRLCISDWLYKLSLDAVDQSGGRMSEGWGVSALTWPLSGLTRGMSTNSQVVQETHLVLWTLTGLFYSYRAPSKDLVPQPMVI